MTTITTTSDNQPVKPTLVKSANLFVIINEAITNSQNDLLRKLLRKLPLEQFNRDLSDQLLSELTFTAATVNNVDSIPVIFEAWERVYPPEEKIPFFVILFTLSMFESELLAFIARGFPDTTIVEVFAYLTDYDSGPDTIIACRKAVEAYGDQSLDVYQTLYENAKGVNSAVTDFLENVISQYTKFAPIPEWIRNYWNGSSDGYYLNSDTPIENGTVPSVSQLKIPEETKPVFEIPNLERLVSMITEGYEALGYSVEDKEEAKNLLRARLIAGSTEEKVELLRPVIDLSARNDLQENKTLFRILGPANPLADASYDEMENGGCRMFTCAYFDFNEDSGYIDDWFIGSCQQCLKRIRMRWHAVRRPRQTGGWLGCFCSFKCMRDEMKEEGEVDVLLNYLVDAFEDRINHIGIQERTEDEAEKDTVTNSIITGIGYPGLYDTDLGTVEETDQDLGITESEINNPNPVPGYTPQAFPEDEPLIYNNPLYPELHKPPIVGLIDQPPGVPSIVDIPPTTTPPRVYLPTSDVPSAPIGSMDSAIVFDEFPEPY